MNTKSGLRRDIGWFGAMMLGLGSIVGTGVFVSIAVATAAAGPAVILAIPLAALVALCNGLSSAQLAAVHPVSGGTYEYAYRRLNPLAGFAAGWMFLLAKSASAATAVKGIAVYAANLAGVTEDAFRALVAAVALAAVLAISLAGIRRSTAVNTLMVSVTLLALAGLVLIALPVALHTSGNLSPFWQPLTRPKQPGLGFLEAIALMFVAFTGYGRIATLAEEVRCPGKTIPRAIMATLVVTALLYGLVAWVSIGAIGADTFVAALDSHVAPLARVAAVTAAPQIMAGVVAVGAITAMLGVLLNLMLGLSRVVLAMARRRDFPASLSAINAARGVPARATFLTAAIISALTFLGDIRTTWSFSAFTVLIYYALTNLAALQLTPRERRFPRGVSWVGLVACLALAFQVPVTTWLWGLVALAAGGCWFAIAESRRRRQ